MAGCAESGSHFFHPFPPALHARPVDGGTKQLIEKEISLGRIFRFSTKNKLAPQTCLCRGCGRLTAMVGLSRAGRDKRIASPIDSISEKEFQLACFVAPQAKAGQIVALDPDGRTTQVG
jgi:hypothetical protein